MDQLALSAMLADITAVRQRSELLRQYKGYGFNLLQVLGADTDEVKMCRLLYERWIYNLSATAPRQPN